MRPVREWPAIRWLARHDGDFAALRRAGRAAIVMPTLFAVGGATGSTDLATFAAFGSFALLMLVGFTGPLVQRVQAQVTLCLAGAVLVTLGTLASANPWLAAATMTVVAFAVLFAGVVSSVLAGATTSLLLSFILPVSLPGDVGSIPARLAGWGLASVVSCIAIVVLWPQPVRTPLRHAAAGAARALAGRVRAEIAVKLSDGDPLFAEQLDEAAAESDAAVARLRTVFLATPYRPTGLSIGDRAVVRLVDQLTWLNDIVIQATRPMPGVMHRPAGNLKLRACDVLEQGADLLDGTGSSSSLIKKMQELDKALGEVEQSATTELPVHGRGGGVDEMVSSLHPSFRAQEMGYATSLVGQNLQWAVAADSRGWLDRLLGRVPAVMLPNLPGTVGAARERVGAHVEWHSVTLRNSIRAAVGLGLAVLLAYLTGVQHGFWVTLATLSVLRSNALSTGQNAVRGLLGTLAGFVIGAGLLALIGTNSVVLWTLLPFAILVAGVAPAAISFAAGQAGFTLVLVILFNIIQPEGWRVGLLRVEDIALGCLVSLLVGLLFWPRGAGAVLRQALSEAYADSSAYLDGAVAYGLACCSPGVAASPSTAAARAAGSSRRLDDAFRGFLAERGSKPLPLDQVAALVTGVAGVRLAADAVVDIWSGKDHDLDGDRAGARAELTAESSQIRGWYSSFALDLAAARPGPPPLLHDSAADGRLVSAVRQDLIGDDGRASATAVRVIWTGDHLDAVRRLQARLASAWLTENLPAARS